MDTSEYLPYRSTEARDAFFALYDAEAARKWPVASEERVAATSYGKTFVRITGPAGAQPLVLLPGASATSLMWARNIQALSAVHRTVAVDQMGDIGRSLCVKPIRDANDTVAWLDELFDALELGNDINLMGVSYGGWRAFQYAMRYPGRINNVVMIAPGGVVLRFSVAFLCHLSLALLGSRRLFRYVFHWLFADQMRKDPAYVDEIVDWLLMSGRYLQPSRPPLPNVCTDEELGAMRVRMLFLVGEHEKIYSARKALRRLRRVAPQIVAEIVPGAGHDISFVQADVVNRRVLKFLAEFGDRKGLAA
jgi:pimeloyl-ACP methyl ester carboxylesterase